jgi:Asp-tRNA(Asn)/Glu-tRNA(Gln) amidotransferase C subunit
MNDYKEYIIQTAELIDLEIAPENLTSVANNFATIAKIASLVTEFPISQDIESAIVFEP